MATIDPALGVARRCGGCRADAFPLQIAMAFQPIVSVAERRVFAYEALVRGADGSGAASVLERLDDSNRYSFDQLCRVTAIEQAAALDLARAGALLSINFLPNAVYRPEVCIGTTLATAKRVGFPTSNIIFEFTESEQTADTAHVQSIIRAYDEMGFMTAIDDFGAGFSGLNLLADFQPDIIKLDMGLVRNLDHDRIRRTIVGSIVGAAQELGITVVAEGVETVGEYAALCDVGIDLMQGYLFARPALNALPTIDWQAVA